MIYNSMGPSTSKSNNSNSKVSSGSTENYLNCNNNNNNNVTKKLLNKLTQEINKDQDKIYTQEKKINELQTTNDILTSKIYVLEYSLTMMNNDINRLICINNENINEINNLNEKINNLNEEMNNLKEELEDKNTSVKILAEKDSLSKELEKQYNILKSAEENEIKLMNTIKEIKVENDILTAKIKDLDLSSNNKNIDMDKLTNIDNVIQKFQKEILDLNNKLEIKTQRTKKYIDILNQAIANLTSRLALEGNKKQGKIYSLTFELNGIIIKLKEFIKTKEKEFLSIETNEEEFLSIKKKEKEFVIDEQSELNKTLKIYGQNYQSILMDKISELDIKIQEKKMELSKIQNEYNDNKNKYNNKVDKLKEQLLDRIAELENKNEKLQNKKIKSNNTTTNNEKDINKLKNKIEEIPEYHEYYTKKSEKEYIDEIKKLNEEKINLENELKIYEENKYQIIKNVNPQNINNNSNNQHEIEKLRTKIKYYKDLLKATKEKNNNYNSTEINLIEEIINEIEMNLASLGVNKIENILFETNDKMDQIITLIEKLSNQNKIEQFEITKVENIDISNKQPEKEDTPLTICQNVSFSIEKKEQNKKEFSIESTEQKFNIPPTKQKLVITSTGTMNIDHTNNNNNNNIENNDNTINNNISKDIEITEDLFIKDQIIKYLTNIQQDELNTKQDESNTSNKEYDIQDYLSRMLKEFYLKKEKLSHKIEQYTYEKKEIKKKLAEIIENQKKTNILTEYDLGKIKEFKDKINNIDKKIKDTNDMISKINTDCYVFNKLKGTTK